MDSNNLNTYTVLPDGRVFAVGADYNRSTYEQTCELILLTPVDASTVTEKTELTLACMNLDWNLRGQIVKFNRASDKYRIVVKDYSEYSNMTYESAGSNGTMVTQSDDGLTKLNTEIMSGNVPDMILTDGLPVRQYAAKGLLEDLYPYIDADMGRDALITPVLDADSEDGKLDELPLSFSIVTATGLESVVGGYTSWTLADLEDALSKLNPDTTIFNVDATRANVLSYCLYMNADTFVDWEAGTASFDSQEFIDYLNFAAQFPAEFDYSTFDWNDYEQDAVACATATSCSRCTAQSTALTVSPRTLPSWAATSATLASEHIRPRREQLLRLRADRHHDEVPRQGSGVELHRIRTH